MTVNSDKKRKIRQLAKKMGCSYSTARQVFESRERRKQSSEPKDSPLPTQGEHYLLPTLVGSAVQYKYNEHVVTIPIVEAIPTSSGLRVVCPYCEKTHLHSFGEGTRVPGCLPEKSDPSLPDDPFYNPQYYLRPIGSTGRLLGWGERA